MLIMQPRSYLLITHKSLATRHAVMLTFRSTRILRRPGDSGKRVWFSNQTHTPETGLMAGGRKAVHPFSVLYTHTADKELARVFMGNG